MNKETLFPPGRMVLVVQDGVLVFAVNAMQDAELLEAVLAAERRHMAAQGLTPEDIAKALETGPLVTIDTELRVDPKRRKELIEAYSAAYQSTLN